METGGETGSLLSSKNMSELMSLLDKEADIILIDSPPAVILSDAAILSTLSDGVLLVIRSGTTSQDAANRALEAFHQVNANVIGVVLTRVSRSRNGYYSYHAKYHTANVRIKN